MKSMTKMLCKEFSFSIKVGKTKPKAVAKSLNYFKVPKVRDMIYCQCQLTIK